MYSYFEATFEENHLFACGNLAVSVVILKRVPRWSGGAAYGGRKIRGLGLRTAGSGVHRIQTFYQSKKSAISVGISNYPVFVNSNSNSNSTSGRGVRGRRLFLWIMVLGITLRSAMNEQTPEEQLITLEASFLVSSFQFELAGGEKNN